MPEAQYRHYKCRLMDGLTYQGMRTLFIENELLRVGVLLDKGADLFSFLHKPSDTDFLWRSPQGLIAPSRFTPTKPSSSGAFLDHYHGGWQEILPGGGPANYRGAELGLHGEVTHLGWDYDLIEDSPEKVRVRLSVDCIRTPLRLIREMWLESGKPTLFFNETITNLSSEAVDFMWGHHPAFGAPFLHAGMRLCIPANRAVVHDPRFASSGKLEPGMEFAWPLAEINGERLDLSYVQGPEAGFAELIYLNQLSAGWYAIMDPEKQLGIGLSWPLEVFPYLWFWMVYGKAPGYPWWNRAYVVALEPWTSAPNDLDQALELGTCAHLEGGKQISITFSATAITGLETVTKITPDGSVQ